MFPLLEFDICRIFWKVSFLIVLIPFFGVSQLPENQDTTVVQKVSSCPITKEIWIEERKAKNCSSINVTLKYHCLLNHWRNQSYVLCGKDTDIIGYFCPEYDERRGQIQENYDLKCIECPIKYNSSDVYKYTACINTHINGTSNTPQEDNSEITILWFVTSTVFIIVMIVVLFFLIRLKRGYKCCTIKGYARPSFQDVEMSSMMDYTTPSSEGYLIPGFYFSKSDGDFSRGDRRHLLTRRPYQQGHSVDFSQPIKVIEKLHGLLLIEYIHLPTSDFSFASELLHCVHFHIITFEVKSLSRKVTLNNTFKTTTESHEPGKVYVAEVTVTCEKEKLIVKPKDSDDWERFLQDNRENQVRVILIHSKSLRVIEAKLRVYREYKTVIDSAVKTWEKRENLQCLRGLESYPSVLKYIAGQKDNNPAIKVYLGHDDRGAMNFFKQNNQIPKRTCFEFVNVAEKSKEIFEAEKEHVDYSSFLEESRVRTELSEIINKHAEKLYAKYSSIVGLDAGSMYFEGKMQPCIVIYSLDKDLIPYGEDPLPKTIDGLHCHVREDLVMFGMCFDCRHIFYPNPGCCIGVPSIGIGSAGFLVKLKDSKSPVTGFLTAAHVAARNLNDLYNRNALLSTLVSSDCQDEIVHQLLPDNTQYQVIGKVRESFFGNWREGFGIDAAFVENSEPRQEEMRELQIADETNLLFDSSKVMKIGGTTGETGGLLTGNTFSVCVDKDVGGFYFFDRCFSIESIGRPFFEPGDSGSGVFLMENGKPTKPLGIAFAKLMINHDTAVCRIDKIVEAFGLRVCQNEEPMET